MASPSRTRHRFAAFLAATLAAGSIAALTGTVGQVEAASANLVGNSGFESGLTGQVLVRLPSAPFGANPGTIQLRTGSPTVTPFATLQVSRIGSDPYTSNGTDAQESSLVQE